MRALTLCAAIGLTLSGCGGDPEPGREREPAPARREPAPASEGPAPGPASEPPPAAAPGAPLEVEKAPPPVQRTGKPSETWKDATQGPLATLVYVTEKGRRDRTTPHVIIIGSDPANPHFDRGTTKVLTVLRVERAAMGDLLGRLRDQGLEALPWSPRPADQPIGPERALYLHRDGRLRAVTKAELPEGADGPRRTFTALERAIIAESMKGEAGASTEGGLEPGR